jgi:hypothetical protein
LGSLALQNQQKCIRDEANPNAYKCVISLKCVNVSVSFSGHKILNSGCVEHLNSKQNDTIMKCCQIELDSNGYYYNGDKYDSNFFKWKSFICSLLAHYYCNEKLLNENINAIQRYFE